MTTAAMETIAGGMAGGADQSRRRGARTAALPGFGAVSGGRFADALASARDWTLDRLVEEADAGRFALWAPIAFGAGVVVYFTAAHEPELWAAILLAGLGAALAVAARRRFVALGLALAFAFGAAGFLAAKLATVRAEAPALTRAFRADAAGRVIAIEPRDRGQRRITLELDRLGALGLNERPRRARVTLGADPVLSAGDRLTLSAFWRPPQGPVRPGGYDFARAAFFEGVGATGQQARDVRNLGPAADAGAAERLSARLERLRERLTSRISATVGGDEGAVAAALVTGVRGPISATVEDEMRAAGLSHILSISGLHMALVAGTLFWLVRAALALSQRAALAWPVKSIAAIVALAGAAFYLALSGAEVATQRSFLMVAIVFVAVVVGRPAVTPRNLALAALGVMTLTPEAVLGPSFQMSFAAVAALVAWFEARPRDERPPPDGRAARALRWLRTAAALALVTTLVAGLATAPFAAYHFHRVTPYALAGNALATPLISLIVMPCVVGGLLFAPLGLDGPWWSLMGWGLSGVLAIARAVASWPGSERAIPAFGAPALALLSLGLAWLCVWRTALRYAAAPVIAAGLALAAAPGRPDLVIDRDGRAAAIRGADGRLALLGARPTTFAAKVWLAADGDIVDRDGRPPRSATPRCDAYGCVGRLDDERDVALVWDARAFEEDCRRAALVITRLEAPPACAKTAAVIDRAALRATGALSLTREGDAFVATAARDPAGHRPWEGAAATVRPPPDVLALRFEPRRPPQSSDITKPVDPTDPADDDLPLDDDQ
ncbi:ComEC/Rec2 family competence protein [Methylopila sp. 73B]|uniref:ComEC/Rec2 family competence protein n=1 Tax=Methylopila sp. 73B TaxID=1120792 RepID=UPI001FD994B5|nr:ComEC/Rec2 family competence protein [Methylopila sp. 73B]